VHGELTVNQEAGGPGPGLDSRLARHPHINHHAIAPRARDHSPLVYAMAGDVRGIPEDVRTRGHGGSGRVLYFEKRAGPNEGSSKYAAMLWSDPAGDSFHRY